MNSLNLKEDQFQTAEVIVEAAKKSLRIGEVPITIVKRKHGTSKKGRDIKVRAVLRENDPEKLVEIIPAILK